MKKVLISLILIVILLGAFVLHIFSSTGYFREIENSNNEVLYSVDLPGVEDIEVNYKDRFLIFSSDDRASRRDGNPIQGGLYLNYPDSGKTILLTDRLDFEFYPHGISMIRKDSMTYRVFAINHFNDTHSIEVFDLYGDSLVHVNKHMDEKMISPNDLVALSDSSYYFTNDHGYTSRLGVLAENYLGLRVSNVVYFNGDEYTVVAENIAYANGVNVSNDLKTLYVASPRDFLIKVYSIQSDYSLEHLEDIDAGTGVDNIEVDKNGLLWVGCHPNLLHFTAYAAGKKSFSPSEIITVSYPEKKITPIYLDKGTTVSASTIAVPINEKLFIGTVMDDKVLVIKP